MYILTYKYSKLKINFVFKNLKCIVFMTLGVMETIRFLYEQCKKESKCEDAKKEMEQLIQGIRTMLEEDADIKRLFIRKTGAGPQVEIAGVGKVSLEEAEKLIGKDVRWSRGKSGSKTPSEIAISWQGTGKYPGIDDYVDVIVEKGTVLYRGEPNGTEYFTTLDAIEQSGRDAMKLFEGLQVEKNPIHGYRGEM